MDWLSSIPPINNDFRFLKGSPKIHRAKTTIQHWQLRDLISAPNSASEFYHVNQYSVYKYSKETEKSNLIHQLQFLPSSMCVSHSLLAAGGSESNLLVKDLSSGRILYDEFLGASINNACHMSEIGGDIHLLVSNNDRSIKVFSIHSMELLHNIDLGVAVNYTSISPDGSMMAAVGDNDAVHIRDPRNSYRPVTKFSGEYEDGGFSCSWDAYSRSVAAASQDGMVVVWDVRMGHNADHYSHQHRYSNSSNNNMNNNNNMNGSNVLAKIKAQQKTLKGACRAVKFSPAACIDMLAFTEHSSYLHLVDTRNYDDHQVVRIGPETTDRQIAGLAFSPMASSLFVGLEQEVQEYNIDTVLRRCFGEGTMI
eukprot:gb/GECH01003734.1/.p1 GENE.gb/GECH01003734.1/~~gb/GECH01003734.1/.p1  ORF type:complete len:366 (+),score=86.39 gb/GECH01003734.1/:1-1098(+)